MANGKNKQRGKAKPKTKARPRTNGNRIAANRKSRTGLANNGGNSRPVNNSVTTLTGSDFLTTISVRPDPTVSERVLKVFPISPSAYPGTRLTQMSQLWEFFRFSKFHVRYVPAVPTTLACQLVLYLDLDPSDDPSVIADPDALIRQAVAQTGSQQWNFHAGRVIPLAMRADRQYYFTGLDKQNIRFSQQGVAYLIQVTSPVNFNGEAITAPLEAGSLFIDWTVKFTTPQINPSAAISSSGYSGPRVVLSINASETPFFYKISGLYPNRFYILTPRADYQPASTTSNTLFRALDDEVVFASIEQQSTGRVIVNSQNNDTWGYIILKSNDQGEITGLTWERTGDGLTGLTANTIVLATVYDEPVLPPGSVLRCIRTLPHSSNYNSGHPVDWDLCERCNTPAETHDTSACTGLPRAGITTCTRPMSICNDTTPLGNTATVGNVAVSDAINSVLTTARQPYVELSSRDSPPVPGEIAYG
jgi:hypothetical protein